MDWIGDGLTRIRNALALGRRGVVVRGTKQFLNVLKVMKDEGFIEGFEFVERPNLRQACLVHLSYKDSKPVIRGLKRISRPGLRKYISDDQIFPFLKRFSVPVISTSLGVLSGKQAIHSKVGGELVCEVF
jgi:small subunit ribosomal protein S8